MKLNFTLNKSTFTNLLKRKGSVDRCISHPARDWLITLTGIFLLLCGTFGYHIYLFFEMNRDTTPVVASDAGKIPVDERILEKTIESIRNRAGQFDILKTKTPTIPDPSK